MSKPQYKMHKEHERWQQEHEGWLADIDEWKREIRMALANLGEVEEFLRDELEAVEVHEDMIWENQQRVRAHELAIAQELKDGENATDPERRHIHYQHAAAHERAAYAHAHIRDHIHKVVAEVIRLIKRAREAM
jgi:sulfur relay (sulfurtransferase) DsrC/TusE family protein